MNKKAFVLVIVLVILAAGIVYYAFARSAKPGALDSFAQCITESGTVFYGAFWCPHCQAQKKIFGKSERLLPYVECSTPDAKAQLASCAEKNVTSYPTWDFPDGTRETGEKSLAYLSEKTGCPLPDAAVQ